MCETKKENEEKMSHQKSIFSKTKKWAFSQKLKKKVKMGTKNKFHKKKWAI